MTIFMLAPPNRGHLIGNHFRGASAPVEEPSTASTAERYAENDFSHRGTGVGERFFSRRAQQGRVAERKEMIDRRHDLSIARQARVLGISRGSVYYLPRPVAAADLALMRRIDELHLDYPFAGSRMLQGLLRAEGHCVGRRHVATLMKKMGIEALYRRPNTSKPAPGHKIYPYLLRNLPVTRPNHVWAMDITYIPMARGFVYSGRRRRLVQPPRPVLAALDHPGGGLLHRGRRGGAGPARQARHLQHRPGHQFTSVDFIKVLKDAEIAISMDGKGAWRDNVFVERLWRTIKYEEVYLHAYASVPRGPRFCPVSDLLQQQTSSFIA